LDFADALGSAALEEVPIDFPSFSPQGVFQFVLLFRVQYVLLHAIIVCGADGYKSNS
jgi:hypothetical protein